METGSYVLPLAEDGDESARGRAGLRGHFEAEGVSVPATGLDWSIKLAATPATRAINRVGRLIPERLWHSTAALSLLSGVAGRLLDGGSGISRIRNRGIFAAGQGYFEPFDAARHRTDISRHTAAHPSRLGQRRSVVAG